MAALPRRHRHLAHHPGGVTSASNLRSQYPVLIDAGFADREVPIPWWDGRTLASVPATLTSRPGTTGFPTSPNVHQIAAEAAGDSRVVYVDNDPMVYSHAQGLLAKAPGAVAVLADLRDPDTVLHAAGEWLDLREPVGLMFVACLHHIRDHEDPAGVVARYLEKMAPGSCLVLSHCTSDMNPERMHIASVRAELRGLTFVPRGRDEILKLFNGTPLIDPGLVLVNYWRPDHGDPGHNADRAWAYGAVATM